MQAARQLFETRELPYIKRARASTEPALAHIAGIAHQAAKDGTRHLVLLSGVPGSGKTLVALQLVHARWLDDLAEARVGGRATAQRRMCWCLDRRYSGTQDLLQTDDKWFKHRLFKFQRFATQ